MSEATTLSLRIPPALKDRIKSFAEEKGVSLSTAVADLLDESLDKELKSSHVKAEDIDNQSPESCSSKPQLTAKEIKALRKILRKK